MCCAAADYHLPVTISHQLQAPFPQCLFVKYAIVGNAVVYNDLFKRLELQELEFIRSFLFSKLSKLVKRCVPADQLCYLKIHIFAYGLNGHI